MASKTTNYNLTKPAGNETADIQVINDNMDIIDTKLKENTDALAEHKAENVTDQYKKIVIATDSDNNPTEVEYRRKDNALAIKRYVSNPDTNGYYQTVIEEFYNPDGVTKYKTVTYSFTYLENGIIKTSDGGVVS